MKKLMRKRKRKRRMMMNMMMLMMMARALCQNVSMIFFIKYIVIQLLNQIL
jgi:hypothetical protein